MAIPKFSIIFLSSLVAGLILTPIFAHLARKFGILDNPGHRKTHQKAVAYLGGAAIFTALIVTLGIFSFLGFIPMTVTDSENNKIFFILFASLGVCLVGLWDDVFNVRARYKLMGQVFFAGLFVLVGYRFEVIQLPGFQPIDLGWMAIPVTLFWILAIINAVNMIDGVDGLSSSVAIGSFLLIALASSIVANGGIFILSLAAMGAILGFLVYNWSPARIYMGDAGSNGLGMLLAGSLVALGQRNDWFPGHVTHLKGSQPFPYQIFVVTLMAAYPVLEIILSVTRRLFRGRPVSRADKGHIHHRFLNLGFNKQSVCLIAVGVTFLGGCVPIDILAHDYGKAVWLLTILGVILGVALALLGFLDFLAPHFLSHSRPHYLIANHFIQMQRLKLKISRNREDLLSLLSQTCAEFGVMGFKINVKSKDPHGSPCEYSWERPHEVTQEYLNYLNTDIVSGNFDHFKEKMSLEDGACEASWIFEPHTDERDLDVEYRVLVSEFMKEALERIYAMKEDKSHLPFIQLQGLAHAKVRSSFLSRRHAKRKVKVAAPDGRHN